MLRDGEVSSLARFGHDQVAIDLAGDLQSGPGEGLRGFFTRDVCQRSHALRVVHTSGQAVGENAENPSMVVKFTSRRELS